MFEARDFEGRRPQDPSPEATPEALAHVAAEQAIDAAFAAQAGDPDEKIEVGEDDKLIYDKRESVSWVDFSRVIDEFDARIRGLEQRLENHNVRSGHKI